MYSGTTLNNLSGSIIGSHQKINRVARANVASYCGDIGFFPSAADIQHFEGNNGPDGIKRKSPTEYTLLHFYNPFDEDATDLLAQIEKHYDELVSQLNKGNPERAAFDAAWLAHTVVDGLTPAHHFPYEEALQEIRGDVDDPTSLVGRLVIPGDSVSDSFRKNWAMWGVKGLMSSHGMFELGAAVLLAPITMKTARLTDTDVQELGRVGYLEMFKQSAREVALHDMYNRFLEKGWTIKLSRDIRNHLGPILIRTVSLVWYSAMRDAGLLRGRK